MQFRSKESRRTLEVIGVALLTLATVFASALVLVRFYDHGGERAGDSPTQSLQALAAAPPASSPAARPKLRWPKGLVAFFPMNKLEGDTFRSTKGVQRFTADLFSGTAKLDPRVRGPFGSSIYFDGKTTYTIGGQEPSRDAIGALDITKSTGKYTVIAWVRDMGGSTQMEFRAGSHIEDGPRTARQYGLYFNGHGYGGHRRIDPHISTQDGPTPGYPYNVDFAASARQVGTGEWHMEAGTYDGEKMIAYLDGVPDSFPDFTEREPEPGYTVQRSNISKNPYFNDKGINASSTKKVFSFGASLIGDTPYVPVNATTGWIGGVAVFDRALTERQIKNIRLATTPKSKPVLDFDFYSTLTGKRPAQHLGWKSYGGPAALDASGYVQDNTYHLFAPSSTTGHLIRESGSFPALAYFPLTPFAAVQVSRATFQLASTGAASPQRLAVRFGDQWFVSAAAHRASRSEDDPADWSRPTTARVSLARSAQQWRPLAFSPDEGILRIKAGQIRPSGPLTAIGFYSDSAHGPTRIKHLRLWR